VTAAERQRRRLEVVSKTTTIGRSVWCFGSLSVGFLLGGGDWLADWSGTLSFA
jgi:hypothetical protein